MDIHRVNSDTRNWIQKSDLLTYVIGYWSVDTSNLQTDSETPVQWVVSIFNFILHLYQLFLTIIYLGPSVYDKLTRR